jgi:lipopolysaccharide transport system ATP-binding protein
MSNLVINIDSLSKQYRLGVVNHGMLYKDLRSWWARKLGKEDPYRKIGTPRLQIDERRIFGDRFWALKDISFDVRRGDRIGIVGRNGAGKSTLLKILSHITAPTKGEVRIKGRVASLLEVGTGFHPELTGRENVYLNGAILGMKKAEITRKFDEIVAFAEVEDFIDTPVKRYSSGMRVRLAFAVAAHLEPEILVVDEVLAVGDISFQKKCLNKMEGVSKEAGRTVLFVSHNLAAVRSLCERGIVLEEGREIFCGSAADAVVRYTELMRKNDQEVGVDGYQSGAKLISAAILDKDEKAVTSVDLGEKFYIEMKYKVAEDVQGTPVPNIHVKTEQGAYVFVVNAPGITPRSPGLYIARCTVPRNLLNDGIYTIDLAMTEYRKTGHTVLFWEKDFLTITVVDDIHNNPDRYGYGGNIPGVIRPVLEWSIDRVNGSTE